MKLWERIVLFLLVVLLIGFSWLTLRGSIATIDQAIIRMIYTWRSPGLTQVMIAISLLGNQALFVAAAGLFGFLIAKKRWKELGRYLLLAVGQELINHGFKVLVARPRPDYLPLVRETTYSFPSGHSMAAIVYYGALALWLREKKYGGRHSNWAWFALAAIVALLIGISRIYLGAHYPSDVLAGFLVGAVWLLLVFR